MRPIKTLSLTPVVSDWLARTGRPRILHVFPGACNLVNERRQVLSIVTLEIGNGPFNLVIADDLRFSEHLRHDSQISIFPAQLILGDLVIDFREPDLWDPTPGWGLLHKKRVEILNLLNSIQFDRNQTTLPAILLSTLADSIVAADIPSCLNVGKRIAGLGIGLTPSGDDVIIGALYAAWIIHPHETVSFLASEIAKVAAPSTTSLSAAWLRSAGRGEAGELWHEFFDVLISGDDPEIQINRLISVGETSGVDAFAGFLGVMSAYKERIIKICPS